MLRLPMEDFERTIIAAEWPNQKELSDEELDDALIQAKMKESQF